MPTPHPLPALSPEFLALQPVVAGRYSLERELGRGGMGVVFLARDVALDRPVAIKLLPRQLASSTVLRERFLREARTAARLSHPHIVPIHAVESHDELAFFVMSFIDGETLGERVRRAGPLPPHEALRVTQEVAWALGHAHAHGVVHRDVKPDNILLERGSGRALVTDFGIAHHEGRSRESDPGGIAGTPRWMSPEQALGEVVDARSDIYSLGLTAWFAVTGRHPFEAESMLALRTRQLAEEPASLAVVAPGVPLAFVEVVRRAMARDPAERMASADEIARAAREARGAEPAFAAPVRRFVMDAEAAGGEIGMALAAAGSAAGVMWLSYGVLELGHPFFRGISGAFYFAVLLVSGGLAGVRVGQLIDRARHLLRAGYGFEAVRPALANAERERREDRVATPEGERGARRETWVFGSIGAAKTALAIWLFNAEVHTALEMAGFIGSVIIPAVTIRKVWSDLRRDRPSLWNRLLGGRAGRALFGIAGIRLGDQPLARPAAGESTALAIGRAADALFDALPSEQRQHLSEVPRLIARLESDALALRERAGDEEAGERLSTVVAALESLRLDLLRLHAGTATLDDLTADLEAARRIRDEVDVRVEARRDVARLLEESPTPT